MLKVDGLILPGLGVRHPELTCSWYPPIEPVYNRARPRRLRRALLAGRPTDAGAEESSELTRKGAECQFAIGKLL